MQLYQLFERMDLMRNCLLALVIQVTFIAGLTLVVTAVLHRRTAAVRHSILCRGLTAVMFVPVAFIVMQETQTKTVDFRQTIERFSMRQIPFVYARSPAQVDSRLSETATREATPLSPDLATDSSDTTFTKKTDVTTSWPANDTWTILIRYPFLDLIIVWLAGFAVHVMRLAHGCLITRQLVRQCRPNDVDRLDLVFSGAMKQINSVIRPRLLRSSMIKTPLVVGLFHPAVIVPNGIEDELDADQLKGVLLHELAHVERRDNVIGLFQRLVAMIWWPHPLIHSLNGWLSQAREEICDNYALKFCEKHNYARTLLQLSTRINTGGLYATAAGLLPPRWQIEDRIKGMLDEKRLIALRSGPIRMAVVSVAMLTITILLAGAKITPPDEEEVIDLIKSLGGQFSALDGSRGTERLMIMQDWEGTTDDLKSLKYVTGLEQIWFSGTTIEEICLEDLPDLTGIIFNVNFYDQKLRKQVYWSNLPIKTIRLKNLPKIKGFHQQGGSKGADLRNTQVTTLDLKDMKSLTRIETAGAQLQDGVLASVSEAPNLTSIELSRPLISFPGGRTQITDNGLASLQPLDKLTNLDLSGARITDAGCKKIGMLQKLEAVGLTATDITDNGLAHLIALKNLKAIGIGETAVTDAGLRQFVQQNQNLTSLNLAGSAVTAEGLEALKTLAGLTHICVDSSQLTKQSCGHLSSLPIKTLQINGSSDRVGYLEGFPKVQMAFIEGTENLTIAPGSLPELKHLYLRGAGKGATRAFFENLPHTPKLTNLEASPGWLSPGGPNPKRPIHVHVDDELMRNLPGLTSLEYLSLSLTEVSDDGLSHISGLENLQTITLVGSKITNGSLKHFKQLKKLTFVNLNLTSVDQTAANDLMVDLPNTQIQAGRMKIEDFLP